MPDIRILIGKQKNFYDSVVSVECKMLNDNVYFRSEGFAHLIRKTPMKRRPVSEQYLKLKCLSHAPEIIRDCTKIIETRTENQRIKGKKKTVVMYELIDRKKRNYNIAVIIRRIGTGRLHFRSVKKISDNRYFK
jgi:hypothetical protein